jgi:hypothetical protein
MLMIDDVLISDAVVQEAFVCNLNACKGACCWEGDYGAPLDATELLILQKIYSEVSPFLTEAGRTAIAQQGVYVYYDDPEDYGTPLVNGGACAYMTRDEQGIAQCGIELAWRASATDFRKPVSCQLYPIRITPKGEHQLEMMNYDQWDICAAACELGRTQQIPVYRFVREAIIRKYGASFYEALDAAAQHLNTTDP